MNNYTGIVAKATSTPWGDKTIHSFQLEGNKKWFRCNDYPKVTIGSAIKFDEDKGKVVLESIQSVEDSEVGATPSTPTASASSSVSAGTAKLPTHRKVSTTRDVSIEWQSSRKDAIAIAVAAMNNECIDIPKSAAKAKKFDLFRAIILQMTEELYEEVQEKKNG